MSNRYSWRNCWTALRFLGPVVKFKENVASCLIVFNFPSGICSCKDLRDAFWKHDRASLQQTRPRRPLPSQSPPWGHREPLGQWNASPGWQTAPSTNETPRLGGVSGWLPQVVAPEAPRALVSSGRRVCGSRLSSPGWAVSEERSRRTETPFQAGEWSSGCPWEASLYTCVLDRRSGVLGSPESGPAA